MTQRRRTSKAKAKRRFGRRAFLTGAGVAACAAAGWCLRQKSDADHTAASGQDTPTAPNPALPAGEWRAVWVSYLDWALLDFSTEDTFRAGAAQLLDNCAGLGLNTVLAQVRPSGMHCTAAVCSRGAICAPGCREKTPALTRWISF